MSDIPQRVNAMTVDVEDYFQVSAFEAHISRERWEHTPRRVEANVDRILALFARARISATFFTLGWVAERHPAMVRRIVEGGHELASHGWDHTRVHDLDRAQFRDDITRSKALLEDLGGVPVRGYRAPSYSINGENLWAHEVLAEAGYRYSSSIAPVRHDLYGMPGAPRFAFPAADGRLLEVPVTTLPLAGRQLNVGGGGWFRLFPYAFSRWALRRVNEADGESAHFYFHPWEIDPAQPRVPGVGARTRFRHYLNLARTERRLERLLTDFRWDRMDRVFLSDAGDARDDARDNDDASDAGAAGDESRRGGPATGAAQRSATAAAAATDSGAAA